MQQTPLPFQTQQKTSSPVISYLESGTIVEALGDGSTDYLHVTSPTNGFVLNRINVSSTSDAILLEPIGSW